MATYQVRHLHCIQCDQPVRARNLVENGVEQEGRCPSCNRPLSAINLRLPELNGGVLKPGLTIVGETGPEDISLVQGTVIKLVWPSNPNWPAVDDLDE